MSIALELFLFKISPLSGITSLVILVWKAYAKRKSFINQLKEGQTNLLLFSILCEAERSNKPFILSPITRVAYGHTQGNSWLSPYKCYPILFSHPTFGAGEFHIYKIDFLLKWMIKIRRVLNIKIIKEVDCTRFREFNMYCFATYKETLEFKNAISKKS